LALKTIVFALYLSIGLWSCQSAANSSIKKPKKDTVVAVAPKPYLDPTQYKRYHDMVADFVEKNLSSRYFNGGILVAKNGVPVYERYTGFSNLRKKDSMTAETPMQVASTGKTLTSGAILKLVQDGKMGLDDPLEKFFPNFPYQGITVKMLLNHRSGLPNYLYYFEQNKWKRNLPATNQDVLNTLYQWHPPITSLIGKHFTYCNTNYVLLALIVEKVSKVPYPQFMKDSFFIPLGMTNSFVKTQADSANVVYSYKANGGLWPPDFSDGPYGDKNIYTTCRDLLKWDQALYNGFIRQDLLDSAFTPYSFERPGVKNYGLGWHLLLLPNNKKVIYHNGKWHGFTSAFARLTDEHVTIIMTSNKYNMGVYQMSKKMYNLFGPYDGRNDNSNDDEGGSK
jgi:CubicO group peptidase (beta-lactamase class C family)